VHGGLGGWKEGEKEGKIPPFQAKSQRLPKTHRFLRFTSPPEAFCRAQLRFLEITASVANQRSAQASTSKGSDNQRGASISGRRNAPPEPGNGAPSGGAGRSEQPRRQIPCAAVSPAPPPPLPGRSARRRRRRGGRGACLLATRFLAGPLCLRRVCSQLSRAQELQLQLLLACFGPACFLGLGFACLLLPPLAPLLLLLLLACLLMCAPLLLLLNLFLGF
jgi:hypothetical protein